MSQSTHYSEIVARYRAGQSYKEIRTALGIQNKEIAGAVTQEEQRDPTFKRRGLAGPRKKPAKARVLLTEQDWVTMWRMHHHEGLSCSAIARKFDVHTSTVFRVVDRVANTPRLLALSSSMAKGNSASEQKIELPVVAAIKIKSPKADLELTTKLLGENAFLRWWNEGERKGWVDLLLKEVQK